MHANMYLNMHDTIYPILEFTEDQQQPMTQQDEAWMCDPLVSGTSNLVGKLIMR